MHTCNYSYTNINRRFLHSSTLGEQCIGVWVHYTRALTCMQRCNNFKTHPHGLETFLTAKLGGLKFAHVLYTCRKKFLKQAIWYFVNFTFAPVWLFSIVHHVPPSDKFFRGVSFTSSTPFPQKYRWCRTIQPYQLQSVDTHLKCITPLNCHLEAVVS